MSQTLQHLIDRATSSDEVLAVIVAAIFSSIGWIAIRIYSGKPKVAWAFSHQHAFFLKSLNPPLLAYTKEIWVQNVVKVDHLNPKEYITLSIFQTGSESLSVANVRWHGGVGKRRPMGPQQIFPRWWNVVVQGFILFGFFSLVYFLIRIFGA